MKSPGTLKVTLKVVAAPVTYLPSSTLFVLSFMTGLLDNRQDSIQPHDGVAQEPFAAVLSQLIREILIR